MLSIHHRLSLFSAATVLWLEILGPKLTIFLEVIVFVAIECSNCANMTSASRMVRLLLLLTSTLLTHTSSYPPFIYTAHTSNIATHVHQSIKLLYLLLNQPATAIQHSMNC